MTNKEIAKSYLNSLYDCGGMSSDVYGVVTEEFDNDFEDSDFENKNEVETKFMILKHLDNVGGISSDVFSQELNELGIEID